MNDEFIEDLRASAYDLARHEAGHFVIARVLGYPSDEVHIEWSGIGAGGGGGNSLVLDRSFGSLDEVVTYCSHRVLMLYAGSMAENVMGGRVLDERVRDDVRTPKAADDFSKVRENLRVIVGIVRNDGEGHQSVMDRINDELWRRAADLVVRYDAEIEALARELQRQITAPATRAIVKDWTQPDLGAELK